MVGGIFGAFVMAALILLFVVLGAYGVANNMWEDVVVAFALGVIGYLMKVYDYSRVIFVLSFVLGDYVERYFLISTAALGTGFLSVLPIATVLFSITFLGLASGGIKRLSGRFLDRFKKEGTL